MCRIKYNKTIEEMNIENIYHTLNQILQDNQLDNSKLKQQIVSLTSNIRTSLNSENSKTISIKPSNLIGVKKGLLVGINYVGTEYELNGCINDVNDMSQVLQSRYGFNSSNIELMTDNTSNKPTKINIINGITNLLKNSIAGDTLVIAYSGHGTNVRDTSGDEWDGYDELIVPLDMNLISDDEINSIIRANLKSNVNVFTFFDCCFSESILDLRYQYLDTMKNRKTIMNSNYSELAGNLVCISGCQDNQTSADAYINGRFNGALTWAFIQSIKSIIRPNWLDLLNNMKTLLNVNRYTQIPQMSSGKLLGGASKLFL